MYFGVSCLAHLVMLKILSSEYQACGKICYMRQSLRLSDFERKSELFNVPYSKNSGLLCIGCERNYLINDFISVRKIWGYRYYSEVELPVTE